MAETGTPGLLLMERASQAVAEALLTMTDRGAVFVCGPGNNGGDGYAAARLFAAHGRPVWIWAASDPERLRADARINWQRCVEMGLPVRFADAPPEAVPEGCGAVVDALFGTGLSHPLEGVYARAVEWMNGCGLPVLSVDMPSGTPELMVRAARTVTFHRRKVAHLMFPGREMSGEVTVADIGIPATDAPEDYAVLEPEDAEALLPPRPLNAHKGTCGHVLLLAGSAGMAGAAGLAANAALRGGAGLVSVACPPEALPVVQCIAPCATCVTLAGLGGALAGKSAAAAGPGLGRSKEVGPALLKLLEAPCPQVWDADALNWLSANPARLDGRFVLTPHPGEAARLLDTDTASVTADPIAAAEALHAKTNAVILLKGATTVIIGPGQRALHAVGTPGMATGGSGDVLTGLIAALLAQGLSPYDSARLGALLHGLAGREAAARRGIRSMTAWDMMEAIRIE